MAGLHGGPPGRSPGEGQGVLRRKPIEHIEEAEGAPSERLTRTLGLWQLTAIGVGGIIGAGIFTLAGTVANGTAGPAVLVSFLIAGVASAAAAFSYAEFAGLIPKAGSAYTYGYAVLGELAGWFIGWDLLLEYTAIVAVVAIGISGYFNFVLTDMGAELPAWMLGAPGLARHRDGAVCAPARADSRDLDRRCRIRRHRRFREDRGGGGADQHRHPAGLRCRVPRP
jgi:APA family basic amino acid/polyamine antiporter